MTTENKEPAKKINWTPIIITGAAVGGIYAIIKLLQSGEEADKELARRILEDWQLEFDQVQPYVESMYSEGRTPTEGEVEVLSSTLDQMKLKEYTINELSKSVWAELGDMAWDIAAGWGIIIGVTVTGYVAIRLAKNWIDKNKPPPNFPCPKCGEVFSTEGALKYHIENQHTINYANLTAAQQAFLQTPSWVQNAIAVESGLYDKTFIDWRAIGKYALIAIAIAAAIALVVYVAPAVVPALQGAIALAFA